MYIQKLIIITLREISSYSYQQEFMKPTEIKYHVGLYCFQFSCRTTFINSSPCITQLIWYYTLDRLNV